ncbi:urease accessory protein UreD [Georgenia sp. SYP-B2076]|uniref:urease accessory protein UreD n=1 Tax=Georgenia sp. SYP-B2076 TaxID=2495881 RepID=UPI00351786F4
MPAAGQESWRGELALTVRPRGGRSVAVHQFHRGALRVLRPMYLDTTGQVTYVVVNPGGAYLDRDRYRIDVAVGDGGDLMLTTQSATKVYRTPEDRAVQQVTICLGPGSRLEYLPDQLIAYRGARYRQDTRIEMAPTASLMMSEVVTPGWSPSGTPFLYTELRLRSVVTMGGRPVAVDNLVLAPRGGAAGMSGMGLLEGHTHVGSLLVVDPRADEAALQMVRERVATRAGHLVAGVSAPSVPGLALRVLGTATQEVNGLIMAVVNELRVRWFGQPPADLRKY